MSDYLRSVGRGFARLLRFGGRDSRLRFWPFAIFVFALGQIVAMTAMLPILERIQRYALEHPGQSRIESGPGQYSVTAFGGVPELAPALEDMMRMRMIVGAITIALLAAAVARRLHDCDRRAYWGLLPLPFLGVATRLMPKVFTGLANPEKPDLSAFFGLLANNLAYFAALGWLIYLLVAEGTPGANRFGPPSD